MSDQHILDLVRQLQIDYGPSSEWDDGDVLALAAAYLQLQDEIAQLWPHYTSTYCIHAHHEDCRETCKTCGSACLCKCHKALL